VNRAPSDEVLQTADQFQPDEVAFGSLQSLQNILLPQLARLSQLLPPVPFHRSLSADKARRHEYIGPTTLPLNPLVWSFPEHSLSLVSETYSTLPQITAIGDRLTAEYAATALGGNLAGWDITFGLSADPALDTRAYAVALSRQLADSIPHSSGFSSRLTPLALAAKAIDALPLSEASTTAVTSQSQAATELLQPTQEGEAGAAVGDATRYCGRVSWWWKACELKPDQRKRSAQTHPRSQLYKFRQWQIGIQTVGCLRSVTQPATAAAATIAGLISSVRPVGLPWRPLKLRLEDDAQTSRPCSLSGFMARHMEHPAARHSKPASSKIRSRPSDIACFRTSCEPGTTIARTCAATLCPEPPVLPHAGRKSVSLCRTR
jgi:hypothetical protein